MRDRITLAALLIIGAFVMVSLGGALLLALNDKNAEGVWRPLFDLVSILVGAVAGYIGGTEVERNRRDRRDGE